MKSWPLACLVFLPSVSTAALPKYLPNKRSWFSGNVEVHEEFLSSNVAIHGRLDGTDHVVDVSIPCKDCVAQLDQDHFLFTVRIHAAEHECSASKSVILGRQALPTLGWRDHIVTNAYHFQSNPSDANQASVNVSSQVQLTCLDRDTSLLSVRVVAISGQAVQTPHLGVSLSFTQLGRAQVIRIINEPLADVRVPGLYEVWGDPKHSTHDNSFQICLDKEYRKLQDFDKQMTLLKEARYRQEHKIGRMIIDEFTSCRGMSCYLRTATSKAPYLKQVLLTLFNHHRDLMDVGGSGAIQADQVPWFQDELDELDDFTSLETPSTQKDSKELNIEDGLSESTTNSTSHDPQSGATSQIHDGGINLMGLPGDTFRPAFHQGSIHTRLMVYYSIAGIILFLSVAFIILKCTKIQLKCCCDPRRKRDWAAQREERRNRAAYKRAAFLHKFQRLWSNLRQPKPTSDYEEKRSRILSQEGILEYAMQNEITQLQQAHSMATDMVRAERERQRLLHDANFGSSSAIPIAGLLHPVDHRESNGARSITTLPLYSSPPPSYETELGDDMSVVEGFSCHSSSEDMGVDTDRDADTYFDPYSNSYSYSDGDNATESSVVDCNSRMSFETGSNGTRE